MAKLSKSHFDVGACHIGWLRMTVVAQKKDLEALQLLFVQDISSEGVEQSNENYLVQIRPGHTAKCAPDIVDQQLGDTVEPKIF